MPFPGFDTSAFPGTGTMGWLKKNTNLVWCGYYLAQVPSHEDTSWMGQRENLLSTGWGLAPIYVGQQIIGPGSHNVTASQGELDGKQAVQLMKSEGFPAHSWVYLDLENGPPYQAPQSDYVQAWAKTVQIEAYNAGIYCSHDIAAAVQMQLPDARIWAFRVATTESESVPGAHFSTIAPSECGYLKATMWQYIQNGLITIDHDGRTLLVDLSSSTAEDPSR